MRSGKINLTRHFIVKNYNPLAPNPNPEKSPFCGATGTLCFGIWLTLPMGF